MTNVWYIGPGVGSRIISAADWVRAGIIATKTIWSAANGWSVDEASLSAEQLTWLGSQTDFLRGQSGPRTRPTPVSGVERALDSNYAYYVATKELYDQLEDFVAPEPDYGDGAYGPAQYGLDAWTNDPAMSFQGTGAHGIIWITSFIATKPKIGRIVLGLYSIGSGTPSANFVALFDKHGVRKALVNVGNDWYTGSSRRVEHPFTPVDVTPGDPYFVAILSVSNGTQPGFVNSIGGFSYGGAYMLKGSVDGLPIRNGYFGSGQSAIPANIDVDAINGNQQIWAGVKAA